ncbi:hypothetical protein NP233_g13045 [Leucocoprinus birnbaumii]|uniref:Zn(2)-C6 fungal-type domain-containing protein n=1 Tax=Leucocoprinus birnbaumii TaxID=56174 RepID=A0AAD5YPF4_9AGAR|nr:hypothetical protein NP233_g13045 [Leucocoprinus birnbaumii]
MADVPPRPLKRQRKATDAPAEPIHAQPPPQPVDHIFIADGLLNKKPGGKKAPLSCCECRRLKLKCDRNFPCASCKKRGCAEICPDGVLVSGKGTRFILANTEQLHDKIQEMSDRIRHLEDSLRTTNPDNPLLAPDLTAIKSTMGLYSSNGTPANPQEKDRGAKSNGATSDDGQKSRGDSATLDDTAMRVDSSSCIVKTVRHAESPFRDPPNSCLSPIQENSITFDLTSIQADIHRINHSFPLPPHLQNSPERNLAMREHIRSQLPSREEAERLWDQARRNALWQYNPHPSATFFPLLLHHIYSSSSDESPKPIKDIDPRRLALLLMILSVACIVDVPSTASFRNSPPLSSSGSNPIHAAHLEAESRASRYHALGRAALCEVPIMEDTNVETVLALFYEVWFLAVWSDGKKAVGEAWGIMGLVAKLAQSIGLHRSGGKSKVIPEEVDKRRTLFWELLYLDARLSLSLGRPPSLSIHHMDCPTPSYSPDPDSEQGEASHHWQEWKHSCYKQCLVPVLDAICKPGLEYRAILDLDRSIRDFSIPASLRNKDQLKSRSQVMQRASLGTALEAVLLQLHRSYFIRALSGPEEAFNRRHKYAPSVVAVFLSASRMIATVQELFQHEPEMTARILWYWSNAFSAAIALCLLVSRAPFTCLSPATLQELERARLLFRSAKEICPRASQVLPILETMIDKANDIYNRWSNGQELPTIVLRHITEDGTTEAEDFDRRSPPEPVGDPFLQTHQSLAQCIAEVHQIAKTMFPLRKPCNCASRGNNLKATASPAPGASSAGKLNNANAAQQMQGVDACPPSHEWSPPPVITASSPVLPDATPVGLYGGGHGVAIGYSNYGNGRVSATSNAATGGTAAGFSSLSGSGMYQKNGVGYAGYANGIAAAAGGPNGVGVYSPSAHTPTTGYPNSDARSSPTFRTTATPPGNTGASSSSYSSQYGTGLYTSSMAVLPASGPPVNLPPPSSKIGVVDTINFELGALSASSDQSFMVFY